jgi:hypothetical protein
MRYGVVVLSKRKTAAFDARRSPPGCIDPTIVSMRADNLAAKFLHHSRTGLSTRLLFSERLRPRTDNADRSAKATRIDHSIFWSHARSSPALALAIRIDSAGQRRPLRFADRRTAPPGKRLH